jgi:hypothetical protein
MRRRPVPTPEHYRKALAALRRQEDRWDSVRNLRRRIQARKEREMAEYTAKENTGTLFKNDRRDKDTQPHAKGRALIGGVWYWVSAWTKEPRAGGDRFQSLSFEEMAPEYAARYGGGQQAPAAAPRQQRQPTQRPQPGRGSTPFEEEAPSFENDPDGIPFAWEGRDSAPL